VNQLLLPFSCYLIATIYKIYYTFLVRVKTSGKEHWKKLRNNGTAVVHLCWHGHELILPFANKNSNVTVMISMSKDGDLLANTVKHLGYSAIRGSSSRRSSEALQEMITHAKNGNDVTFATDGPKGPRHKVKPGVIITAAKTGLPIISHVANASRKFVFNKSWDKGILPLPFSKAIVLSSKPMYIEPDLTNEKIAQKIKDVENETLRLTENANYYFNYELKGFNFFEKFFFNFPKTRTILLYPFGLLYGFVMTLRNQLFNIELLKRYSSPAKIISVGNITLGGTGKTPFTIHLAQKLKNKFPKEKISIVMRSFDDEKNMFENIGLEAIASKKKVLGVKNTVADTIIVDDGFQHRYFKRDIDIVLVNAAQEFSSNSVFPAGTLREPKNGLKRADIIVLTRCSELKYDKLSMSRDIWGVDKLMKDIEKVNKHATVYQSSFTHSCQIDLTDKKVLLVSAIANPTSFYNHALEMGAVVKRRIIYPDHYMYTEEDYVYLNSIKSKYDYIITTEKDAAKLNPKKVSFQTLQIQFIIEKKLREGKHADLLN
jgi:tetraacyldisaccharide 4'-kinase